jgi:hypothetical protein
MAWFTPSTAATREDAPVTSDHTGGFLLIVGSVVFGVGAAVGVPGVFTDPDPRHAWPCSPSS